MAGASAVTLDRPFIGIVSENGRKIYFDHDAAFKALLLSFAAREIEVYIRPRVKPATEAQRGYWFGELVKVLMRDHGYTTKSEAHDALVRGIFTLPWERIRPSFSPTEMNRDEMADAIDRASCWLVTEWLCDVSDPEPDPVRRLENRR